MWCRLEGFGFKLFHEQVGYEGADGGNQDTNNTILTTVYKKPTHTDQYLHWDSNHFITTKNSVYNTLAHRAKVVSSTPEELTKELDHLKKALMACQFPNWALNRLQ